MLKKQKLAKLALFFAAEKLQKSLSKVKKESLGEKESMSVKDITLKSIHQEIDDVMKCKKKLKATISQEVAVIARR